MSNTFAMTKKHTAEKTIPLNFALAGNPNCGKTTIFNQLTGSRQYVGNWTGVTVEKKEGKMKNTNINIVDLPGIYSLSSTTLDEIIARDYIVQSRPDALLDVIDASNLERNLYLTLQLLELEVPMILILNMMDEVEHKGLEINIHKLEKILGVKCISTSVKNRETLNKISEINIEKIRLKDVFGYLPQDIRENIEQLAESMKKNKELTKLSSLKWLSLKLLENDENVIDTFLKNQSELLEKANLMRYELEQNYKKPISEVIILARYEFIYKIIEEVVIKKKMEKKESISDKIDKIVTNKFLAIPIFLGVMLLVYYVSITSLGDKTISFMEWLVGDVVTGIVIRFLDMLQVSDWMYSLIVDGIIGGMGAVIIFVPQIMILFMFIAILEDSGYMARIAFVMDKLLRNFGLSGKSFIPLVVGSGCSVPGIMATRTIENVNERKLTVLLTPFISCGAKLPIYVMFASAFFAKGAHWVVFSLYVLGIVVAMFSGILLSKTKYKGKSSYFIMELPPYRIPQVKNVLYRVWDRGKEFLMRAGTIIFAASVILWFLQSFTLQFEMTHNPENSILAFIGSIIAPIFKPLGFGDWKTAVAFFTGFAAKEAVISTLGAMQGVGEAGLASSLHTLFTPVSAYSFLVFILLASPCFAAQSAMKNEFNSWRETGFAIFYQTGIAWVISMLVYQIGIWIF
ncbi:ferrous iron transport protein B [Garciella nitratireducens]|uniref:Ferrous iron transport protein B n=1 Tax=Garciella nitratireducens DSM 15102 TaxID=1121911 RepID=A0A1T4LXQ0_9FIRM|nr:ferrous iron transport protein B [Garciella nitratireducens]SJZ59519.1 ferrous iron transport protein B [Garciella nitratireducens DSM 15102]